jgi:hypothetical protein
MSALKRLVLPAILAAACFTLQPAKADRIERVTTTATPDIYDGKCPVLVKLQGNIIVTGVANVGENFGYRWESANGSLTDDAKAPTLGRQNRVEATLQMAPPPGDTLNVVIRLHVMLDSFHPEPGRHRSSVQLDNYYSQPVNVAVTCR